MSHIPGFASCRQVDQTFGLRYQYTDEALRKGYCYLRYVNSHGKAHPLYQLYNGMLNRCYFRSNKQWQNYGARGIYVCGRWFYSFDAFVADMGERPRNATLDRIDNDGPYSPENCRWATRREQSSNKTRNGKRGKTGWRFVYFNQNTGPTAMPYKVCLKKLGVTKCFQTLEEAQTFVTRLTGEPCRPT